ncbi:hypothetical protein AGR1B_Cc120254 [Agrobacterium fabacearum S56]|jgi:hypothetical protein|nr:hypothetical protein AGR1C_Cc10568 [Agrobacterium fabacearum TT111]CUW89091.1 hypothetical protein AGR1B_Cc120254 [Agrobacterium fabacearum S56]
MYSFIVIAKYMKKRQLNVVLINWRGRKSAPSAIVIRLYRHPIIARAAKNKPTKVIAVSKRDNIF